MLTQMMNLGIIGDILTPKGSIDMLGSTFLIDDGAVRFVGTDYANPELDMKATKRMPKYGDINIELTGMVSIYSLSSLKKAGSMTTRM